jgi:hypothetical protein
VFTTETQRHRGDEAGVRRVLEMSVSRVVCLAVSNAAYAAVLAECLSASRICVRSVSKSTSTVSSREILAEAVGRSRDLHGRG